MDGPPRIFDRRLHGLHLARAAGRFSAADFLKARAAADIVERLEAVNRSFETALDLGARTGVFARALGQSPAAGKIGRLVSADLSARMLDRAAGARVVVDEERLPFAPASLDLVVSSLSLHWVNDLIGALTQVRLALKPDGLFIGALLGGHTLSELRTCIMEAESELRGGAGPRVSPFVEPADAGSLLQRAGFALPVADTDEVEVRYDHPLKLIADLRAMGETGALVDRPTAPLTRAVLARAMEIYGQRHAGPDGRIVAGFQILTLTGWAPHPDQPKPARRGSGQVSLAEALKPRER
ncbi:MAG TPA: methyltransferase domain-containing protein [Caulobacteraceae bacterium]|jgi:SAM-dependent methyltransferase|nr:methyltransferase domain-containing protein [Caulobacteraceae bacterium]